jgi:hypothetical protein
MITMKIIIITALITIVVMIILFIAIFNEWATVFASRILKPLDRLFGLK